MDELKPLLLLVSSGLILRFSLSLTGQSWAKSHSQTVAFMILPVITYVITKTISGNIALSLGMIGALSIVRFRHPVKSALELIMYFDLITIGIATSVRTKWAINLTIITSKSQKKTHIKTHGHPPGRQAGWPKRREPTGRPHKGKNKHFARGCLTPPVG